MKFVDYIENKDIIAECFQEVEYGVTEGWGYFLADMATFMGSVSTGLAIGGANPVAGGLVAGGLAGASRVALDTYIRKNLDKLIIQNKDVAKYIKKKCDEILAKKKRELKDNTLSKKIDVKWNSIADVDDMPGFMDSLKHTIANTKDFEALAKVLDGYHLYIMYDSDHLQKIIFYAQSQKTGKIYGWTVPAPDKGEAAKIFHKE